MRRTTHLSLGLVLVLFAGISFSAPKKPNGKTEVHGPPNRSSSTFSESSPIQMAEAVFALTSPNGGETINAGTEHEVTWDVGDGSVDNVELELLKGGSPYAVLVDSTPNDGSYMWHVVDAPGASAALVPTAKWSGQAHRVGRID